MLEKGCGSMTAFVKNLASSIPLLLSKNLIINERGSWESIAKSIHAAAAAKSLQSCPILCDPNRRQPIRLPVPGILQARTLEWVAISFSSA